MTGGYTNPSQRRYVFYMKRILLLDVIMFTNPSQRRYVYYMERILSVTEEYAILLLQNLTINEVIGGCVNPKYNILCDIPI